MFSPKEQISHHFLDDIFVDFWQLNTVDDAALGNQLRQNSPIQVRANLKFRNFFRRKLLHRDRPLQRRTQAASLDQPSRKPLAQHCDSWPHSITLT